MWLSIGQEIDPDPNQEKDQNQVLLLEIILKDSFMDNITLCYKDKTLFRGEKLDVKFVTKIQVQ